MKLKVAAIAGVGLLVTIGVPAGLQVAGIEWAGFLNKKVEQNRTEVLKESQSWTDGKRRELNNLYLQYQSADVAGKVGIANVVRDAFAAEDTTGYPQHLQAFLVEVKAR